MHNNEPQGHAEPPCAFALNDLPIAKTHRQLFEDFYKSVFQEDELSTLFSPEPVFAKILFEKMIRDIQTHGGLHMDLCLDDCLLDRHRFCGKSIVCAGL